MSAGESEMTNVVEVILKSRYTCAVRYSAGERFYRNAFRGDRIFFVFAVYWYAKRDRMTPSAADRFSSKYILQEFMYVYVYETESVCGLCPACCNGDSFCRRYRTENSVGFFRYDRFCLLPEKRCHPFSGGGGDTLRL